MEKIKCSILKKGIAIGPVWFLPARKINITKKTTGNRSEELERYKKAKKTLIKELRNMEKKEASLTAQELLSIHAMLIEDEDFMETIENFIKKEGCNAEYAVKKAAEKFSLLFNNIDDEYMRARSADIEAVGSLLLEKLSGKVFEKEPKEPSIIMADQLNPEEVLRINKNLILGIVVTEGTIHSHLGILVNNLGIPSLSGVEKKEEFLGKKAVLNAEEGLFIVDPEEKELKEAKEQRNILERKKEHLNVLRTEKSITKSGKEMKVFANIGSIEDAEEAAINGAEGVGLFRTEFLFLNKEKCPSEKEQYDIYVSVAKKFKNKLVVIRTVDLGTDKTPDYFDSPRELNPALGYRGIRISLDRIDIFKTQLKALLRASAEENIAIMYPIIISVEEVIMCKRIVEICKKELSRKNVSFGNPKQGIMIETPAAALISDELAKEVDFFSLGTNDLIQYTLGVDRQNAYVANLYNGHHKGIMKLMKLAIVNAKKAGIWVGICGDLAGDISLTKKFLSMGITELSVAPNRILELREKIRSLK